MMALHRGLGLVWVMILSACSSDSKAPGTAPSDAGANTGGASAASGGGTGTGGVSGATGGASNASGGSGTQGAGGKASAGGAGGLGGAGGGAGGKGSTGGGSAVQASAECVKYCDCMSANCADKVVPGGCLASCGAQKNWDLPCRQNMCNLAPAQPNNDHCTHALAVGECLDK